MYGTGLPHRDAVHRRRLAVAGPAVLSVQPRAARQASGDPLRGRPAGRRSHHRGARLGASTTLGFRSDDVVIGSVGRLVEQKDYPTQLRAFALAAARVPSLRMAIAGDGPLRSCSNSWRETSPSPIASGFSATGTTCRRCSEASISTPWRRSSNLSAWRCSKRKRQGCRSSPRRSMKSRNHRGRRERAAGRPGERLEHGGLFVELAEDRRSGADSARSRAEAQQHSLQAAVAAYESL